MKIEIEVIESIKATDEDGYAQVFKVGDIVEILAYDLDTGCHIAYAGAIAGFNCDNIQLDCSKKFKSKFVVLNLKSIDSIDLIKE